MIQSWRMDIMRWDFLRVDSFCTFITYFIARWLHCIMTIPLSARNGVCNIHCPPWWYLHLVESTLLLGEGACVHQWTLKLCWQQHSCLEGHPCQTGFEVGTQTKRDTLVLQVGGWAWGWRPHPVKNYCYETSHRVCDVARVLQEL
jgi:hypothetical protein